MQLRFLYVPVADLASAIDFYRDVPALREIDQHQGVAERVDHHREATDGDVARRHRHRAAGAFEGRGRGIDGIDEPVGLVGVLGREHELGVGAGERQARLAGRVVAPDDRVPELVAVEGQPLLERGHRHGDRIDAAEHRPSLVHAAILVAAADTQDEASAWSNTWNALPPGPSSSMTWPSGISNGTPRRETDGWAAR